MSMIAGWNQVMEGDKKHYFERDLIGSYFDSLCNPDSIYVNTYFHPLEGENVPECEKCHQILNSRKETDENT